jgi:hypothetical protein
MSKKNSSVKAKSKVPRMAPKTAHTRSTIRLNRKASCLVGQWAFRSSATTSAKKVNLDFLAGAALVLIAFLA